MPEEDAMAAVVAAEEETYKELRKRSDDERVLNNFFDDRKGTVSAFEDEFSKQLDDVQKSIESKIEDKMQSVQSDFLSRIDAAVSALRASDGSAATATSAASAAWCFCSLSSARSLTTSAFNLATCTRGRKTSVVGLGTVTPSSFVFSKSNREGSTKSS